MPQSAFGRFAKPQMVQIGNVQMSVKFGNVAESVGTQVVKFGSIGSPADAKRIHK